jgi:molybdate transport system ATP-binding protein
VACDAVTSLMSRPDLSWLRQSVGLGAVFDAVVSRPADERRLAELTFDGGRLLSGKVGLAAGATVRVRIPAREVILATRPPEAVSLHNVLSGAVAAIHADPSFDSVIVQVEVGRVRLLAEVTSDAVSRLQLAVGCPVHALVKSVSIDLLSVRSARGA